MRSLRYWLLRLLAGRTAVVLNTDIRFLGTGCHVAPRDGIYGTMFLHGNRFTSL